MLRASDSNIHERIGIFKPDTSTSGYLDILGKKDGQYPRVTNNTTIEVSGPKHYAGVSKNQGAQYRSQIIWGSYFQVLQKKDPN